jgi:hypothetical protein
MRFITGFACGLALTAMVAWAGVITPAVDGDKAAMRDTASAMIDTLDQIQADVVGSPAAETQQAVKKLAEHQEKIIRYLASGAAVLRTEHAHRR